MKVKLRLPTGENSQANFFLALLRLFCMRIRNNVNNAKKNSLERLFRMRIHC